MLASAWIIRNFNCRSLLFLQAWEDKIIQLKRVSYFMCGHGTNKQRKCLISLLVFLDHVLGWQSAILKSFMLRDLKRLCMRSSKILRIWSWTNNNKSTSIIYTSLEYLPWQAILAYCPLPPSSKHQIGKYFFDDLYTFLLSWNLCSD